MISPQIQLELTDSQRATLGNAAEYADVQPGWDVLVRPVYEFSDVEAILLLAHRVLGAEVPDIVDIVIAEASSATGPETLMVMIERNDLWVSSGYELIDQFKEANYKTSYYIANHVMAKLIEIRNHIVEKLVARGYRL